MNDRVRTFMMHRTPAILAGATGVACVAALAIAPASAAPDEDRRGLPTIHGFVDSSDEFRIREQSVPAGRYKLVVQDTTDDHNFHFTGPGGVNVKTGVDAEVRKVFKVNLESGRYTAVCDPHRDFMRDTLTVT